MTVPERPSRSRAVVLLADHASFEAGYIASVLQARAIAVVGPFADLTCAIEAITMPDVCAAVIGPFFKTGDRAVLAEALSRRGVPCLTLLPGTAAMTTVGEPMLRRPFAAYQVADWIAERMRDGLLVEEREIGNAPVSDDNRHDVPTIGAHDPEMIIGTAQVDPSY